MGLWMVKRKRTEHLEANWQEVRYIILLRGGIRMDYLGVHQKLFHRRSLRRQFCFIPGRSKRNWKRRCMRRGGAHWPYLLGEDTGCDFLCLQRYLRIWPADWSGCEYCQLQKYSLKKQSNVWRKVFGNKEKSEIKKKPGIKKSRE